MANPTADLVEDKSELSEEEGDDDDDDGYSNGSRYSDDDNDNYDNYNRSRYSDDDDDDSNNGEKENYQNKNIFTSSFLPGVPAAIYAFLQIYPPKTQYTNVTSSKRFKEKPSQLFDFFYYPDPTMDHSTVKTINEVSQRVTKEIDLFQHIDPDLLSQFILKIYGNAHTVVLDRKANQRKLLTYITHYKKQQRRNTIYAKKQIDYDSDEEKIINKNGWKETTGESKPSIALMVWGSKFAHSCSPNLLLQYDPTSNTMMFIATKLISQGELLTFSYLPEDESLGGLICGTTESRRLKLQKFKFFDCECNRCQSIDVCRGSYCPKYCLNEHYDNHSDDNQQNENKKSFSISWFEGDHKVWKCEKCQSSDIPLFVSKDIEKGESYVEKMITSLSAKIRHGDSNGSSSVVDMMESYLNKLLQRLANQLGLTISGFKEGKVYIVDYLHECLWSTNPIPVFFAAWYVLEPIIKATINGTEEKLYILPPLENNQSNNNDENNNNNNNNDKNNEANNSDNSSDDGSDDDDNDDQHKTPVTVEVVVKPMPDEWKIVINQLENVIVNKWMPTIKDIFKNRNSVVVDDMLNKIQQWANRIEQSSKLP
ncbi:unnamed protein product [Cunninghamella blakesleeana]